MIPDSVTLSSPLSLYSIPVVYFTAMYPHLWKVNTIMSITGFNNVYPRANVTEFAQDKRVPPKLAGKIKRMEGAHCNGLEQFPVWTAAILVANLAGLDNAYLNKMSLGFIAMRILFNQIYIAHESNAVGWVRTAVFFGALSFPTTLLLKGAAKYAAQ
ncbi:hypothetical protein D9756_006732 [Leucocoprinus leucothites]|uniref:Uncharacterized protein n=1 Tax=Leucocoprinus leucothites TaxID=201217 RepID=A0A8H5LH32_9AGAR|nr:hypothetical protein D9756_006732 [Leucoagaricus leucothites]